MKNNTHTYLVEWNNNEDECFTNLIEVPAGLPWHDTEDEMDVPLFIKQKLHLLDCNAHLEDYRRIKGIIEIVKEPA
tara:strand:+ start:444 stop:671 length:228 start_codon:yes stop_codon:yes gene_type:complete